MQRYINAIFFLLVVAVSVWGFVSVGHKTPNGEENRQVAVDALDPAPSLGAGAFAGICAGILLSIVCLVVFPRFRAAVIGKPIDQLMDNPVSVILWAMRVVVRFGIFLAFVSILAGKLGSAILA